MLFQHRKLGTFICPIPTTCEEQVFLEAKCHHPPARPSGLSRYQKLLWSLLRAIDFSGPKENSIPLYPRKFDSTPWVMAITVFDTDRGTPYLCHYLKNFKNNNDNLIKKLGILWGFALYFLITCIGTEYEKMRQDITHCKLELKISVYMLVNFEFRIWTWNLEFWLNFGFGLEISNFDWILNIDFNFRILILNFET